MKPHEETWDADGCEVWCNDPDEPFRIAEAIDVDGRGQSDGEMEARAAIIAKAPEMARMLLAREYDSEEGNEAACGACKLSASSGLHRDDCAWLVLMKAIGAR